ncbi:MAG TPA: ribonuclease H [Ilumatobacteraceae bacterium]|nr:ribonuclease H [Ilumatobacteraceae bacterium]
MTDRATDRVAVYTDGACRGNPGPGGWAWAVAPEGMPRGTGGEAQSTNQRMEIKAALEAMRSLPGPMIVRSDSTYVVNCVNKKWYVGWKRNGWRNSAKQPVANQDLWRPFFEIYDPQRHTFEWVKGHSGDRMNDMVDALAVAASKGPFDAPPPPPSPRADPPVQPAPAATLF